MCTRKRLAGERLRDILAAARLLARQALLPDGPARWMRAMAARRWVQETGLVARRLGRGRAERRRRPWPVVACVLLLSVLLVSRDSSHDLRPCQGLSVRIAPYLFLGGSQIPDAGMVMGRTGIRAFTVAFVLSDGGCRPAWGGTRPLRGAVADTIAGIQAVGGQVVVSFGGWSGHKLGLRCRSARALAAAYQRVIDTYRLRAIDIDIERREFENARAQDRVLRALSIVEASNPGLTTFVTLPVTRDGLNSWGQRLVRRAAELRVPVDVWTIMPFVLGPPHGDMGQRTIRVAEHTHRQLARYHPGLSATAVYRRLGISTMNGDTGAGETVTQADFREIRRYVHRHDLGRFTFWAINRDRSCLVRGHRPCSGVPQHDWQFTTIISRTPPRVSTGDP